MMKQKRITKNTVWTVILLSIAGELAWGVENQYFNVFVYNTIAPNTFYISLMVAASAITATITAITMGALSDKIGRRKVFFLIGFPMWSITTAIFPLAGLLRPVLLAITVAITFDCIMTFFGAMASDAALKAYIVDVTTLENRGKLHSLNELGMLFAILLTYGVSGFIIEAWGYFIFFYLVGGIVGILGTIGALLAKEPKSKKLDTPYWSTVKSTFNIMELRKNKDCFLVLTGALLWGIAFNVFFPYILIFLNHYRQLNLIEASIVMFIAIFSAILLSFPVGVLTDRIGRKRIAFFAIGVETVFLILFALSEKLILLILTGIGVMFGMILWDISTKVWSKDLFPADKRGQFAGYYILFTVLGAMTIGPFIGDFITQNYGTPIVIDGQPGFIPPPFIFIVGGIMMLLAYLPLLFAKEAKNEEIENEMNEIEKKAN